MTKPLLHLDALTLDLAPVTAAFDRMTEALRPFATALAGFGRKFGTLVADLETRVNAPAYVAGVEGRLYVRAAMHPDYAAPADLDALVRAICAGTLDDVLFMRPANRLLVATAAMRGWAQHHETEVPVLAWHRLIGADHVTVTRSAA